MGLRGSRWHSDRRKRRNSSNRTKPVLLGGTPENDVQSPPKPKVAGSTPAARATQENGGHTTVPRFRSSPLQRLHPDSVTVTRRPITLRPPRKASLYGLLPALRSTHTASRS